MRAGGKYPTCQHIKSAWCPGPDSCLMQDEPETGIGFSYEMSLKGGIGMLGIDHQHGRFGSNEPGADSGVSGGQWRGALRRTAPRRGIWLDRGDVGAASVQRPEPAGEGLGAPLCGPNDGPEPGSGDATDH